MCHKRKKKTLRDWDTYILIGFTCIVQSDAKPDMSSHYSNLPFVLFFWKPSTFMLKPEYRTQLKVCIQAGNT